MKRTNAGLVERFHRILVEEIRKGSPTYLRGSFTVAEIYQSLIPYRTHRDRLGVEMNGDYEDALLRLLSGEGEYLLLESEPARARIRRELQSSSPNTGIYREFAAVGVRLNPVLIPPAGEGNGSDRVAEEAVSLFGDVSDSAELSRDRVSGAPGTPGRAVTDPPEKLVARPSGLGRPAVAPGSPPPLGAPSTASSTSAPSLVDDGEAPMECPECNRDLPRRTSLRFCPYCGVNVFRVPCDACGEELERAWSFCVACGEPRS